jgi:hypothetical protein
VDRSEFGKRALEQLKKARPGEISILDEDRFHVVTTSVDGKSSITSLANYYDEYLHAEPELKLAIFERIAKFGRLIDGEESLDEVRVLLVPRIRPRRYFEIDAVQLASTIADKGAEPKKFAYQPLAEHLGIGLAIDRPEHIEYIGDASRYSATAEELDEIALTNLKRMTKASGGGLEQVHEGLWLGNWSDEYAAERMLMPELFTKLGVMGDPVCFLPGAERLYVVGSDDERSQLLALSLVEQRMTEPRSLLSFPFVLRDGTWRVFEPKGELGRELGGRLAKHLADAYAVQKESLEAKYSERDDPDAPFVASIMGIADADGNLELTLCTWNDGVHAFLPRAEVVAIGRLAGDIAMVPWEDVMELAGDCLRQVKDLYPTRWETKRFPDDALLAKLRTRAIDLKKRNEGRSPSRARSASIDRPAGNKNLVILAVTALIVFAIIYALSR